MSGKDPAKEAKGAWIWHAEAVDQTDTYVFFRREFALAEVPTYAELSVAVNTTCHVYINGRHVTRGPAAATGSVCHVGVHDVGFCLQVGRNVIGVLAHNTSVSRFGVGRKASGLWVQLAVDEVPALWTDKQWQCLPGKCYHAHQPRVSQGDAFVEYVDLRHYPPRWTELDFTPDASWGPAAELAPAQGGPFVLKPLPGWEVVSEPYTFTTTASRGEGTQTRAVAHVSFPRELVTGAGVYVAETYIHSYEDMPGLSFQLYSDDPYYLLVGAQIVKAQGARPYRNGIDPAWNRPRTFQQEEVTPVDGVMDLRAGWNRVQIVQQLDRGAAGVTLLFPKTEPHKLKFLRGDNNFSLPGWNLAGPLRTPFAALCDTLALDGLPTVPFNEAIPTDVAAHLMAFTFTVTDKSGMAEESFELKQGEYVLLEFDRYVRGCPEFTVGGHAGDHLDVLYGDYTVNDAVQPLDQGVRQVYSLVVAGEPLHWQATAPHGMKYLMFFARQARTTIKIENPGVRRTHRTFREPAVFNCSDELFNQIWEVGVNTVNATFDGLLLNSAGARGHQLLADAMIQSLASFYVFGDFTVSEKCLREFAAAQYETGEIPAIVPGDYQVRFHDMALLWPVWLQKHVLHSGNQQLLKDMMPHLERLLVYFEGLAVASDGLLLGNPEPPYDVPCFIDFDSNIDRRGVTTALNALYVHALLKSEWLFAEVGMKAESQVCHDRASAVGRAIRHLTWDEEKGLFADGYYDGKRSESFSMQANCLALYSGLARENQYRQIFEHMFMDYAPYHRMQVDRERETPYFKFFLLDMTFSLNLREWAVDFMRYYWGKMLALGATSWWRNFSPDIEFGPEKAKDLCYGSGASPNYFLITEVLGIRPAIPGYAKIYFNPMLSAVEWARASIPTPRGTIQVDWGFKENGDLEAIIEANYPLEVVPLLDPNVASNATIRVSDEVVIVPHTPAAPPPAAPAEPDEPAEPTAPAAPTE